MSKIYNFHIESFHLPYPYDEEFYQHFPMELTDEQFERLYNAFVIWRETDEYKHLNDLADDEYFLHKYVPDIWEKFRAEISVRAPKIWDDGIIPYLSEMDMYVPDEVWERIQKQLIMNEKKKIQFCARQGIGEDAIIFLLGLSPETAQKMVELRKANPGKYQEEMPDGQIYYKDMDLVKDASAALKAEKSLE